MLPSGVSLQSSFLSHLSGDEVANNLASANFNKWQFLSHLSGDEVTCAVCYLVCFFLSHLSGDEADFAPTLARIFFLSHLSGDEA